MKNKIIIKIFFITIFTITFTVSTVLFLSDPLQLFNSHSQKGLVTNARHQVAGIINKYSFDSIILGTSLLENTSAKESSKVLGGKFMNISLSGSDFNTRSFILEYTLKNKKIKKVIYSLDSSGLVESEMSDTSNFDFLYDDNKLNDLKVYISQKYLICSLYKPFCIEDVDIDRPFAWYKIKRHSQRFGGLDNWFKANNNNQIKDVFKSISQSIKQIKLNKKNIDINLEDNILKSKKYIDDTIIKYVSEYPNTEFILIIPPYSRIKYAIDAQYNISLFKRYKLSIQYLVSKSNKYSNLKIYAWGNHSFVDNIANYKDLHHYEYKINSWMLSAIKKEEGLLTVDNIDNYLTVFTKKALDYDLFELGDKINAYLNKK
jgi:hypothetical protein